jgi:peroxiredoxin
VNRPLRFGAALLLTIVAAWAGWHRYVRVTPNSSAAPAVDRKSAASPRPPVSGTDPESGPGPSFAMAEIPERLPDFTLQNREGKPTSIVAWRGKSLVLNFWATWCAPCRREIPLLEALDAHWNARNVAVVGIAVDRRAEVLKFAEQFHIAYPLLIGEQDALDAATAMGVASPVFPFTVFTDRRGEVVAVFVGELHRPQAELILGAVEDLNEDRIALQAARRAIAAGLDQLAAGRAG